MAAPDDPTTRPDERAASAAYEGLLDFLAEESGEVALLEARLREIVSSKLAPLSSEWDVESIWARVEETITSSGPEQTPDHHPPADDQAD